MFTGIIVELGKIYAIQKIAQGARFGVISKKIIKDISQGDSIAVNGVCLTVSEVDKTKGILYFDVSHETLKTTTLGELRKNEAVNLEPAMTLSSRVGGHLVTGHVEGTGKIKKVERIGNDLKIEISAPKEILKYCIKKGSIAVDGISLTIVDVFPDSFTVVIIPYTAKMTTIGIKKAGQTVNLESDIIAKYVEKFVKEQKSFIERLKYHGFIQEDQS